MEKANYNLQTTERELENIQKAFSMIYMDYVNGRINREEYDRYRSIMEQKEAQIVGKAKE